MLVDLSIIVIFLIANLAIGYWSSTKTHSFKQFSVGERHFSSFFIFCTLSATFIGGGYTIGNASKVFSGGMVFAVALLGFSLKEVLVACLVAPRMDRFRHCLSVGDMMRVNYGKHGQWITGVLSILVCGGILGAQVGALAAIIRTTLHINIIAGLCIGFSVLLIYSTLGGMRAVVLTDTLQFAILALGIPLTFFIGLHHIGGWHHLTQVVPHHYLHFLSTSSQWSFFMLLFLTWMLGETLVPPYVQRLFLSKDSQHTVRGTLASGLASIPLFLLCGGIGLVAYVYQHNMNPNEAFPFLVQQLLPVGLRGFVIAALLSIILSSAAGFLNAASISFVNDVVKIKIKRINRHQYLWWARLSTLLVGIISILFALFIHNVLDILLLAYQFWSPIILPPLLAVIFSLKAKARDFYAAALAGILASILWHSVLHNPLGVPPVIIGVAANALIFLLSRQLPYAND